MSFFRGTTNLVVFWTKTYELVEQIWFNGTDCALVMDYSEAVTELWERYHISLICRELVFKWKRSSLWCISLNMLAEIKILPESCNCDTIVSSIRIFFFIFAISQTNINVIFMSTVPNTLLFITKISHTGDTNSLERCG